MVLVDEILYKYGSVNENKDYSFQNMEDALHFIKETFEHLEYEPEPEDFDDMDRYRYHHSRYVQEKNATKDSVKWFAEYSINGKLIGKGMLDL